MHNMLGKDKRSVSKDLVIYHIAQAKEINQKDLVKKLNITPASVSSLVNQMELEGLLTRIQDEKDGRKFKLSLTETSQGLLSPIINSWLKIQEEITKGFTEEEKATFLRLLRRVEKNLDKLSH